MARARSEQHFVIVYEHKNISNDKFTHKSKTVLLQRVKDREQVDRSKHPISSSHESTYRYTHPCRKHDDLHADVRIFDLARGPTFNQGNHIGPLVLPRREDSGRSYTRRMAREV